MTPPLSPSLFSRVILLIAVAASLAGVFWVGAQFLEPVPVPAPPTPKGRIQFNTSVDVSQNPVFTGLEPLGPFVIEPGELGRPNPFVPVISVPPAAVSSTATSATTTDSTP